MTKDDCKVGRHVCSTPLADIAIINEVVPCRFDGIREEYVRCEPRNAQYYAIKCNNTEADTILIEVGAEGMDQLIDMI